MDSGAGAPALAAGKLLIDTTTANTKHLSVGSVVPVKFAQTGNSTMRIGGIFKPNALLGSYLVGDGFFLSHFDHPAAGGRPAADSRSGTGATASAIDARAQPPIRTSRSRPGPSSRSRSRHQVNQLLGPGLRAVGPGRRSSPSSASSTP